MTAPARRSARVTRALRRTRPQPPAPTAPIYATADDWETSIARDGDEALWVFLQLYHPAKEDVAAVLTLSDVEAEHLRDALTDSIRDVRRRAGQPPAALAADLSTPAHGVERP
jgi:hypothetical protein